MTTTAPKFRYIGITDECVECQCCGKYGLKSTVVLEMLDVDGNHEAFTFYGSTCAARALNVRGGARTIRDRAKNAHLKTVQQATYSREVLTAYGTEDGTFPTRGKFERAVTSFYRRNCARYGAGGRERADLARETFELVHFHAARIAEAKLVGVTV